jgi:putative SOS response-associated peptidase YedK
MCGRFSLRANTRAVATLFDLPSVPELAPRYNIAPSQPVAVAGLKPDGSGLGLTLMRWGLVPRWWNKPKPPTFTVARADTVAEKPAFRDSFRRRRCLIPADGFVEWPQDGRDKWPFYFRRADHAPFAFAGLWDTWADPGTGRTMLSCCFITTDPNELVARIHDRMPVIVDLADFGHWLDAAQTADDLVPLLRPSPASGMEMVALSKRINSPKYDDPECLEPRAA